ncbi:exopolysaccharide biosynthesis protein [Blastochloris sulfoviridis]|nr:exopolysaccharide biosynthesis protein [Blastochloris sulfoviridis]
MSAAGRRTSDLLSELAVGDPDGQVTFGEIFHRLEHKAFGALFLVLAIPNCFPMVPGISVITGCAILLLAMQLAFGREEPWLPAAIRTRGFARGSFAKVLDKALPWIVRVERLASPRLQILTSGTGRQVFGAVIAVLAVAMMLPVPIIGNIPPGIAIAVLSLGLLEHDGRVVAVGYALGTVAVIAVASMLAGLVMGFEAIAF